MTSLDKSIPSIEPFFGFESQIAQMKRDHPKIYKEYFNGFDKVIAMDSPVHHKPQLSLSDKQWIFLQNIGKLISWANENGYKLTGGELQRTRYQQQKYIQTGRSTTMRSQHLKKLAIDLFVFIDGDLTWDYQDIKPLGIYWESLHANNKWGGHWKKFKDLPHFQMNG